MADEFKEGQIVYITKYALTTGILTKRVSEVARGAVGGGGYLLIKVEGDRYSCYDPKRREVHTTIEAAQAEARAMAMGKIKSLERSLRKMEQIAANGATIRPMPGEG